MGSPRLGIVLVAGCALAMAGCSAPDHSTSPTVTAQVAAAAVDSQVSHPTTTAAPATGAPDTGRRVITARGVGKVTGPPDTVTIGLGVETHAGAVSAALA